MAWQCIAMDYALSKFTAWHEQNKWIDTTASAFCTSSMCGQMWHPSCHPSGVMIIKATKILCHACFSVQRCTQRLRTCLCMVPTMATWCSILCNLCTPSLTKLFRLKHRPNPMYLVEEDASYSLQVTLGAHSETGTTQPPLKVVLKMGPMFCKKSSIRFCPFA